MEILRNIKTSINLALVICLLIAIIKKTEIYVIGLTLATALIINMIFWVNDSKRNRINEEIHKHNTM